MALIMWIAAGLFGTATPLEAACRQALAIGLDVSGSVDDLDYALQKDGLAAALEDAAVQAAFLSHPAQPIALSVFEWSGLAYQQTLVAWTVISDQAALYRVTDHLRKIPRQPAPAQTALGYAMIAGANMLRQAPDCAIWTLDISGDGKNNDGPRPQDDVVRQALAGVTINGLVVGTGGHEDATRPAGIADLSAYFRAYVIRGPAAFVEVALGFEDYQRAMTRKLLREMESALLGGGAAPDASGLRVAEAR